MAPAKKLLSNQPTTPKLEEEEEEEEAAAAASSEEEEEDPEEEEESSREGEEEEESDDEEQKEKPKTPENKASQVKQKPTIVEKHKAACEGSGEEEDEEEFEEAPHSPSASDFTIKLVTPKNPKSKDSKPTSKRPSETSKSDEKELRRKKKAKVSEEDLKKEKSSGSGGVVGPGRVWSEEDEIRVLHGMIDYQKKKGVDPSADMAAFHDFVKGKLQFEVTRTQLYEKHRRLKQKYFKNMVKSEKGEALALSKSHDTKIFDLSKRVWGVEKISNGVDEIENTNVNENVNGKTDGGKVKKNSQVKAKKDAKVESKNIVKEEVNDDDDEGDFEKKYPFTNEAFSSLVGVIGSHQVSLLKAKLSVVGNATSREFEENWKKLVEQESDIAVKKLRMYADQTERVMDESRRN